MFSPHGRTFACAALSIPFGTFACGCNSAFFTLYRLGNFAYGTTFTFAKIFILAGDWCHWNELSRENYDTTISRITVDPKKILNCWKAEEFCPYSIRRNSRPNTLPSFPSCLKPSPSPPGAMRTIGYRPCWMREVFWFSLLRSGCTFDLFNAAKCFCIGDNLRTMWNSLYWVLECDLW